MLNNNLQHLFDIAQKTSRIGIGLMSGTSLDGLDIALCRLTGTGLTTGIELLDFTTIPYPEDFKNEVRTIFAKREIDQEKLCLLNAHIGTYHAQLVLQALSQWNVPTAAIDFIASHGQTVYHAPQRLHKQAGYGNATLQIGDADHLAVKTGILTIGDFRQKHVAAGGEGAPLALYGDVIMGSKEGENRILLNIGGIANLTYLPGDGNTSNILCTDIGPGNTLIDAACKRYFNQDFDRDAQIAFKGHLSEALLTQLLAHPFFEEKPPKTTGPELFNVSYLDNAITQTGVTISPEDVISTLSAFTAKSIANFIKRYTPEANRLLLSGGGASNPFITQSLACYFPDLSIHDTGYLGINPDAKEAILFALLGNEAIAGQPMHIGANPAVLMGKFSFPL